MKDVSDLADLRRRVQLRGQKVGAHKCVWADGFAMETIANYFQVRARARPLASLQRPRGRTVPIMHHRLTPSLPPTQLLLLVVDERFAGSQMFTRISPSGAHGDSSNSGVAPPLVSDQSTVLLHASCREHMNLIRYNGNKLQQLGDLPPKLQKLWGISVPRSIPPNRASSSRVRTDAATRSQSRWLPRCISTFPASACAISRMWLIRSRRVSPLLWMPSAYSL